MSFECLKENLFYSISFYSTFAAFLVEDVERKKVDVLISHVSPRMSLWIVLRLYQDRRSMAVELCKRLFYVISVVPSTVPCPAMIECFNIPRCLYSGSAADVAHLISLLSPNNICVLAPSFHQHINLFAKTNFTVHWIQNIYSRPM